jgi:hypothetical protein
MRNENTKVTTQVNRLKAEDCQEKREIEDS